MGGKEGRLCGWEKFKDSCEMLYREQLTDTHKAILQNEPKTKTRKNEGVLDIN